MKRIFIMFIPFMLIGCGESADSRYNSGHSDGYTAGYEQLCDISTFDLHSDNVAYQSDKHYRNGWNDGAKDGAKDCAKTERYQKKIWPTTLAYAVKEGGFSNTDDYLRARRLGIKTWEELMEYDMNEMKFSGLRTAGAYYAGNEMCQEISLQLFPTTSDYSSQRMYISFIDLFRLKNISDMSEINPLNNEESKAFKYAKSNEFGDFYNQLRVNATNKKWLMDYLTNNCSPRIIQICSISRAKKDRAVVKICDDLSEYGL